jgi:uncharacterized protein
MSEELKPLFDKKVNCPICSNSYLTKKLRSRFIKVEEIEADFFTHYKDKELNPIFYEVNVCPKCGFSFVDTFSSYYPPGSISLIKAQVSANWKERDYSGERTVEQAVEVYKLAVLSGSLKQEKHVVMAGLCLRLAWIYRLLENSVQEMRFMKLALEKYKNSYLESDYIGTQLTEMRLIYLIGELSRRLGYPEEAVKNFSKVVNHHNRSVESKLVEMAREQWYLIRDTEKVSR